MFSWDVAEWFAIKILEAKDPDEILQPSPPDHAFFDPFPWDKQAARSDGLPKTCS